MGLLLSYTFVNKSDFKKWHFLSLYKSILRVSYYGLYETGFRYESLLITLVESLWLLQLFLVI